MNDENKITRQPEYDALYAFDQENNLEPSSVVAERIAIKHGFHDKHAIVDDIHYAIEDALELGQKRGQLIPQSCDAGCGAPPCPRHPGSAAGPLPDAYRETVRKVAAAREKGYAAARANLKEAWAALAMIRETVETLAPSGSVKASEHLDGPTFMHEADALVGGILAAVTRPPSNAPAESQS